LLPQQIRIYSLYYRSSKQQTSNATMFSLRASLVKASSRCARLATTAKSTRPSAVALFSTDATTTPPAHAKLPSGGVKVPAPPMVYIAGEEMTHYACELFTEKWFTPYFDLSAWERYDLSCTARDASNDQVLHDAVDAGKRIGAVFKEPTITPTAEQKKEMGLTQSLGSPNVRTTSLCVVRRKCTPDTLDHTDEFISLFHTHTLSLLLLSLTGRHAPRLERHYHFPRHHSH
jgi:hypothetical protein